jgi:PAS domain S-box-containing protein
MNKALSLGIIAFLYFTAISTFPQNLLTTQYTAGDGLPSSTTLDLVQDNSGRIWVTSRSGIACYDGISWEHHTMKQGLPSIAMIRLDIDRQGTIWALADTLKLGIRIVFYNGSKWEHIEQNYDKFVPWEDIRGFRVFTKGDGFSNIVVATANSGILWWTKGAWNAITQKQGLISNNINGICIKKDECYIATDKGISVIKPDGSINNQLNKLLDLPSEDIKAISIEHKDKYMDSQLDSSRFWILGDSWLVSFNEDFSNKVLYPIESLMDSQGFGNNILPDHRMGIYYGNQVKLHYYNIIDQEQKPVGLLQGLIGEGGNSLMIDFEKNIWIAGNRGLTKIFGRYLTSYQIQHGLLENEVSAILEYEPGKIVFGHDNGLTFYDGKNFHKIPFPNHGLTKNVMTRTLDMKIDSKRNIWAATSHSGLLKISPARKLTWFFREKGIPKHVNSVWVDEQDKVWVCSQSGLYLKTDGGFIRQPIGNHPDLVLRRISGESKSLCYLLTPNNGIFIYENQGWHNYRMPGESGANNVFSIKKDSNNRLLIGTIVGLYVLNDGIIQKFKDKNFELNDPVYFILEDRKYRLWFGTDNGVVRWDGDGMIRYSTKEGLIGHETNRAAGIFDAKGKLWIGTNQGVSVYDDSFENSGAWIPLPKLKFLHLEVNNRRIPLDSPIKLKSGSNNLVFHFRGISLINEQALRFKEKLEGFSNQWSQERFLSEQSIRYTNLPPGTYRFYLTARNAYGFWSKPLISPIINILKPLYKRWWFILIAILLSLLIAYNALMIFLEKRHRIQLEKQVAERTSQLKASEKKYRALFENSQDAIFTTTQEGYFLEINPSGRLLLGYDSTDDMAQINILKVGFCFKKDRKAFIKQLQKDNFVKDFETRIQCKNGERKSALISCAIIPGNSKPFLAMQGFIRDITEREKLQEQLNQSQKMEAIGTLAGGIAHDFNNILSVIKGYAELSLFEISKGTRLHRNIKKMNVATERAKELINQISTFSRKTSQEKRLLKVGPLVEESLILLRSSLPTTIEIRHQINTSNDTIKANPTQIHQILLNLCTNSSHAIANKNNGVIKVTVENLILDENSTSQYQGLNPGQYISISVSDTGQGMTPAVLKRIFEPYFTTKKGEGTGMGLAVVYGIVKSLGGDILVTSTPKKGSTFQVLIPIVEDTLIFKIDKSKPIPVGKGEHILFVDDEPLLVEVEQEVLEKLEYRVTAVNSGIKALELFAGDPKSFDLIITDLVMPKLTGIQLSRKIKKIRPEIPIILCSGFSEEISPEELRKIGIREFLKKPIDLTILAFAVKRAFSEDNVKSK